MQYPAVGGHYRFAVRLYLTFIVVEEPNNLQNGRDGVVRGERADGWPRAAMINDRLCDMRDLPGESAWWRDIALPPSARHQPRGLVALGR